jgi:hypothetical protein
MVSTEGVAVKVSEMVIKNDKIPDDVCSQCLGTGSYVTYPYFKRKKCTHKLSPELDKYLRSGGFKARKGML